MTLTLPWPPSVNRYWRRVGKKTILSAEARAYRATSMQEVYFQGRERFGSARVRVTITAYPPDKRARDLDNLCKGVLDALQFAGVFDDDSQVDDLRIVRADAVRRGRLIVQIETVTA